MATNEAGVSRRRFLGNGCKAAILGMGASWAGYLLAPALLSAPKSSWYEVVQDAKNPLLWHINLYNARLRGDLVNGTLVKHDLKLAIEVHSISSELNHPARIQFLDGHQESFGMT